MDIPSDTTQEHGPVGAISPQDALPAKMRENIAEAIIERSAMNYIRAASEQVGVSTPLSRRA